MPWLIWPPELDKGAQIWVTTGAPDNWPSPEAYRAFTGLTITSEKLPVYNLPPTRDPEKAMEPLALPSHFMALPHDAEGKLSLAPIEEMPDVLFGAGYSWFVSSRAKALLEEIAPNAVRFEAVTFEGPRKSKVPGDWFLLIFLQFGDVIEEERSTLLAAYETYANWNRPGPERSPTLYARQSALAGYDFWTGVAHTRKEPCNAANAALTYCSDAVMQRLREADIQGFGRCFKIEVLADDDTTTIAPGSPRHAASNAQESAATYHQLSIDVSHSGGKVKEPVETGDPAAIALRVPAKSSLPDMWTLDHRLIVSAKVKALFEAAAPDDVTIAPIVPVPRDDKSLYDGPPLFQLTVVNTFQPFASELSPGIQCGVSVLGNPTMRKVVGTVVVDVDAVGACKVWNSTPERTGAPEFIVSNEMFSALSEGGVTGLGDCVTLHAAVCNYEGA